MLFFPFFCSIPHRANARYPGVPVFFSFYVASFSVCVCIIVLSVSMCVSWSRHQANMLSPCTVYASIVCCALNKRFLLRSGVCVFVRLFFYYYYSLLSFPTLHWTRVALSGTAQREGHLVIGSHNGGLFFKSDAHFARHISGHAVPCAL